MSVADRARRNQRGWIGAYDAQAERLDRHGAMGRCLNSGRGMKSRRQGNMQVYRLVERGT
jgi:hypothetical protein